MADPRIHPSTPPQESAKAPLMPAGASASHKPPPPPSPLPPPLYQSPPPGKIRRRRGCCCRCLCCTLCTILLVIVSIAAAVGILFLVFRPKAPDYSIDSIAITGFNVSSSTDTLSSRFLLSLTAINPNKKIGIYYYEGGSSISAWMESTMLCHGTFPQFYQGHRNTTVLSLPLSGETSDATRFLNRARELQAVGAVPLVLRAKVPVRIKLGGLKLMKLKFKARCALTVDSVSSDNTIRISSSGCKIRVRL